MSTRPAVLSPHPSTAGLRARPARRAPAPWTLVAALLSLVGAPACFTDSNAETKGSDASSTTADSGASGSATSAATSSATSASATAASASSGEETTAGTCAGECTPGDVEVGPPCGICGAESRTCTDACTWSDWACSGEGECAVWSLREGSTIWEPFAWSELANQEHAPVGEVEAAFSAIGAASGFVLTRDTFHVLDLKTMAWSASGPRAELFPEVAGLPLVGAYSVNGGENLGMEPTLEEDVALQTADHIWLYSGLNPVTLAATFSQDLPCCDDNEDWMTADAPAAGSLRCFWLDLVGAELWIDPDISGCDDLPEGTMMKQYGAAISADGVVHVADAGQCFDFIYSAPMSEYPPLAYLGAPTDANLLGGAFFADGIYLVGANK